MLREILKLLNITKVTKNPVKKHLVIQTVYGAPAAVATAAFKVPSLPDPINVETVPDAVVIPTPPPVPLNFEEILAKQKEILLKSPAFAPASIKICTLSKDLRLIGLTKQRLIHSGVLMYSESIRYSREWEELKQHALDKGAGIAKFELIKDIECLQIITPNHGNTVYLIHKDCLIKKAWLSQPFPDTSNTAINQLNKSLKV